MAMRIAVVGCGVAGLTSALLLAQQGHQVHLLEQAPEVGPVGAGVLLQPSGQLVLERLGLLEAVTRRAEPIERLVATTHEGGTLIDLPYGELRAGCRAYGLHRGDLFAVLHAAVAAQGVSLTLSCRVASFQQDAEAVFLNDEGGGRHGPFDLVLITDGARSCLRQRSGLAHSDYEYPHGALWAIGQAASVRGRLWQVTRGTRQLCGLLPMGEGRCSLFWSVHRDEKDALFQQGYPAWRAQVLGLFPQAAELLEGLRSLDELRYATYHHVRMPRWGAGRCLFLGDAAHAMSPHLGQGINLALLDAYAFARCLAASPHPQQAIAGYHRVRRGHVRFYAALTYLLSPFFQSGGVVKGWLRDRFLPLLPRLPGVRGQMLLAMAGLKGGWLGGVLSLPEPRS